MKGRRLAALTHFADKVTVRKIGHDRAPVTPLTPTFEANGSNPGPYVRKFVSFDHNTAHHDMNYTVLKATLN